MPEISGSAAALAAEAAAEGVRGRRIQETFSRAKGVLSDELRRREEEGALPGSEVDQKRIKVLTFEEVKAIREAGGTPFQVTVVSPISLHSSLVADGSPAPLLEAQLELDFSVSETREGNENDL